jgi:hypothetical protein
MTRSTWFALSIAALLIVVAGTVLGTQALDNGRGDRGSGDQEGGGAPAAAQLDRLVVRLEGAGIDTSAEELADLAGSYGVGGAVRIVIWADAAGESVDDVRAMRDAGDGWGEIAHDLGLEPGLGWVMGGQSGDHGRDMAPGQEKPHDNEDEESEAAEPSEPAGS